MNVGWADPICQKPFSFEELKNPELIKYAKAHFSFQGIAKVDPNSATNPKEN